MQARVTDHRPDVAVLHLSGELDADTAGTLHSALADLLERPVPRIVVSGDISCTPDFGPTDQTSCLVGAQGAGIRITHPGKSRSAIDGNLSLERRDP